MSCYGVTKTGEAYCEDVLLDGGQYGHDTASAFDVQQQPRLVVDMAMTRGTLILPHCVYATPALAISAESNAVLFLFLFFYVTVQDVHHE